MEAIITIQDVYSITGIGVVPVGVVQSGTLKIGMTANINSKVVTVKTIEMHHEQLEEAHSGDNIGFTLTGIKKGDVVKGMLIQFTDQGNPRATVTSAPTKPEPIHPKGFLSKLFRR